jgi:hypothetical protein
VVEEEPDGVDDELGDARLPGQEGQHDLADSHVVQRVAAARGGLGDEPEEAAALRGAPVGEQPAPVAGHLGRGARHPLGPALGGRDVVEELDEMSCPAHEAVAVVAVDAEDVGQHAAAQREGVLAGDVERSLLEEAIEQLVGRERDGALGGGARSAAQPGVDDRPQPAVVGSVAADEPRGVAAHRLDHARRRPVGEAQHAIGGQAGVGQTRAQVLIQEGEPLADRRVEDDRFALARVGDVHRAKM